MQKIILMTHGKMSCAGGAKVIIISGHKKLLKYKNVIRMQARSRASVPNVTSYF